MSELRVQGLVKRFGDVLAVDQVSFEVKDREFFALVGPSGSGKTTILRLICGLERPDAGQIFIDGKDVTTLPGWKRKVGVVFQHYGLYPTMNVYDNIAFGLRNQGFQPTGVEMRVQAVAHKLRLQHLLQRKLNHLSQGEMQRVALARALVKNADIYLFDEPLSNLDQSMRSEARREIQVVHQFSQGTSIYITNDQTEALALANRIAVLAQGRIQQIGTSEELLHAPANMFVASFFPSPSMNLIPGFPQRVGNHYRVLAGPIHPNLPPQWTGVLMRAGLVEVVIGIPPDAFVPIWDIELSDEPESDFFITYASIVATERLPWKTESLHARIQIGSKQLDAVFAGSHNQGLRPGLNLSLGIRLKQICLFDPRTELAITPF